MRCSPWWPETIYPMEAQRQSPPRSKRSGRVLREWVSRFSSPILKGSASALRTVCEAQPTVVNHNIETVARLQRAVRPSASYGRSLALLARARNAGMTTKSGLIVGMGEERSEVEATLADLAAVGVSIVTIGQYLRPTTNHLAIQRWWTPQEFEELATFGQDVLGIAKVEASPLTRSSHHAGSAAAAVMPPSSQLETPTPPY